jgi:hypothetical protein
MSRVHNLTVATIQGHCRGLRLRTVAAQSERLAMEAARANQAHLNYLAELLGAEMEERKLVEAQQRNLLSQALQLWARDDQSIRQARDIGGGVKKDD